jgi:hypothetical protein
MKPRGIVTATIDRSSGIIPGGEGGATIGGYLEKPLRVAPSWIDLSFHPGNKSRYEYFL